MRGEAQALEMAFKRLELRVKSIVATSPDRDLLKGLLEPVAPKSDNFYSPKLSLLVPNAACTGDQLQQQKGS